MVGRGGKSHRPRRTSHPAAGLRQFWTASAGSWLAPSAASPAASRRSRACACARHLSSSVCAAPGQRPLQHPAMHRVRRLSDGAVAFQVADDDADGLRGQQRHPGEIGAGQARIGLQHGQHDELRRRDAEVGQRPFQRQPGRGLGLPQQIGEVAFFAALALARAAAAERRPAPDFRRFFSTLAFFRTSAADFSRSGFRRFRRFSRRASILPKLRSCDVISVLL